ncbi:MAG: restriction endonuclease subunit S [Bacillaceae bacterium]|nr:restriction endonuclease subunit S [Bacillaceae bacterium]
MDKLYEVHDGDFIINITFAWEQSLAVADKDDHGKLVSHRFPTYLFKKNQEKGFYKYFFTTKYFKYCLGNASPGGAGRNRVLNKTDFMNITVNVPAYAEQIKISSFLNVLDKKISNEEQKLNSLKQEKQAFMQQMFI